MTKCITKSVADRFTKFRQTRGESAKRLEHRPLPQTVVIELRLLACLNNRLRVTIAAQHDEQIRNEVGLLVVVELDDRVAF